MKFLILLISIYLPHAYATECDWWQTKYSSTIVDKHPRGKGIVREHPRQEYCRNKWKDADVYIPQFKDVPASGWAYKETFKKWSRNEIQTILEFLPLLPIWAEAKKYTFHRANSSIHNANPASSEIAQGSIILYDLFFKRKNKIATLGHEMAHHLFQKISDKDKTEFENLSGWSLEVKDRKIFILPPKNPIKPDSVKDVEEDFSNYLEIYITDTTALKKANLKMYDFFSKRYPL